MTNPWKTLTMPPCPKIALEASIGENDRNQQHHQMTMNNNNRHDENEQNAIFTTNKMLKNSFPKKPKEKMEKLIILHKK